MLPHRERAKWAVVAQVSPEEFAQQPLVRSSRAPVPGLNHLPVDEDLATSDLGRSLMVIRGTPLSIGRPFAVRPGTPADRVAMLRDAIARAVADPKFLADMAQAQIDTYHITADEVAQRFDAMINQPPDVVDAMGKYIKAGE